MNTKVLIVDKTNELYDLMKRSLEGENAELTSVKNTAQALKYAKNENFDLVVLCGPSNGENLHELVSSFTRNESSKPKIVLITDSYKFGSLRLVPKSAIIARRKAVNAVFFRKLLKRLKPVGEAPSPSDIHSHHFGDITLHPLSRTVIKNNHEVYLRAKEFKLLLTLLKSPGRIFTREELKELVWGNNCPSDIKTVEVTMSSLRAKIEGKKDRGKYIMTVRGKGYTFRYQASQPTGH